MCNQKPDGAEVLCSTEREQMGHVTAGATASNIFQSQRISLKPAVIAQEWK